MASASYWEALMDDTRDEFQHDPLGPDEIRLLKVDLDDQSRELSFRIEHFPRDQLPDFQAISYTWGEKPHKYKTISLNDRPFQVTQNAFWCLYFICKHHRQWQYLWMDAICIDQHEVVERNEQVRHMDWVYQKASLVLAWLGSDREIRRDIWTATYGRKRHERYFADTSPYWRRVWIIQELYFARQALFIYGAEKDDCLDLFHHAVVASSIHDLVLGFEYSDPPTRMIGTFRLVCKGRHFEGQSWGRHLKLRDVRLLNALTMFTFHECSDARDKVFGILGLLPQEERTALERYFPDYGMSLDKYRLVIIAHILIWHKWSDRLHDRLLDHFDGDAAFYLKGPLRPLWKRVQRPAPRPPSKLQARLRRKSFGATQQAERAYEQKLVDELCAREELMHKIIAEFEH